MHALVVSRELGALSDHMHARGGEGARVWLGSGIGLGLGRANPNPNPIPNPNPSPSPNPNPSLEGATTMAAIAWRRFAALVFS